MGRPLFFLILALAPLAPGQFGDLDPLVVEILDPSTPEGKKRLRLRGLPVMFRGMQPSTLLHLQQQMRLVARPDKPENQNRDLPEVAPGQHPSDRTLVVRCAPTQDVSWVQAVMQAAWFLPGQARAKQLARSPFLADVRVGLLDLHTRAPGVVLRTFREGLPGSVPGRHDLRTRVASPAGGATHERMIRVRLSPDEDDLGRCTGFRLHATNEDAAVFSWKPERAVYTLRDRFSAMRRRDPKSQVRLVCDPETPFVLVHELLQIVGQNALTAVFWAGHSIPSGPGGAAGSSAPVPKPRPAEQNPDAVVPSPRSVNTAATQDAIQRSLEWLRRNQSEDGRWDADGFVDAGKDGLVAGGGVYDVGVTGLAVLAFLAGGHDHVKDGPFREVVARGLGFLKTQQDAQGCIGSRTEPYFVYGHAIAARAVATAYGRQKSAELRRVGQKAMDFVIKCQNPYQAWRYGERPGDNDMSITSWMVSALAAGRDAGLRTRVESFSWALRVIMELTDDVTGRTGYTKRGERPVRMEGGRALHPPAESESLTAAALHCRVLCGQVADDSVKKLGRALLLKRLPRWTPSGGAVDMIYWYYGTLALERFGGAPFETWRRHMAAALLPNQVFGGETDGAFRPVGPWGSAGGTIYATAMASLVLSHL